MRTLEVLQVECPEVGITGLLQIMFINFNFVQECLTWEAWVVLQVLELLEELAVLVLPSRRYLLHKTFMEIAGFHPG